MYTYTFDCWLQPIKITVEATNEEEAQEMAKEKFEERYNQEVYAIGLVENKYDK